MQIFAVITKTCKSQQTMSDLYIYIYKYPFIYICIYRHTLYLYIRPYWNVGQVWFLHFVHMLAYAHKYSWINQHHTIKCTSTGVPEIFHWCISGCHDVIHRLTFILFTVSLMLYIKKKCYPIKLHTHTHTHTNKKSHTHTHWCMPTFFFTTIKATRHTKKTQSHAWIKCVCSQVYNIKTIKYKLCMHTWCKCIGSTALSIQTRQD